MGWGGSKCVSFGMIPRWFRICLPRQRDAAAWHSRLRLSTSFPVGDTCVKVCWGLLKSVLEAFLLPTNQLIVFRNALATRKLFWQAVVRHPCIVRTYVSGTMACHLMLKIFRKHLACTCIWLSFLACKQPMAHMHKAGWLVPQPCMHLACCIDWFTVAPIRPFWVSKCRNGFWKICYWLCWIIWRGYYPGRWNNR